MSRKLFGWKSKTLLAVIGFTAIVWAASYSEFSKADDGVYLGLANTIIHSDITVPEIGYRYGKYGAAVQATGQGSTDKGYQDLQPILLIYRIIDPGWCYVACFKPVLGAAWTPNQLLIGEYNYHLEVIFAFPGRLEVFLAHKSSAGTFLTNTGLDSAGLRFVF
jgi:hypothetical protein